MFTSIPRESDLAFLREVYGRTMAFFHDFEGYIKNLSDEDVISFWREVCVLVPVFISTV